MVATSWLLPRWEFLEIICHSSEEPQAQETKGGKSDCPVLVGLMPHADRCLLSDALGFTRAIGGMLPSHHVCLLTSENRSSRDVSLSYNILSLDGPMEAIEHLQFLKMIMDSYCH